VLHQVGVSFDLYYDARKHKIKKKKEGPLLIGISKKQQPRLTSQGTSHIQACSKCNIASEARRFDIAFWFVRRSSLPSDMLERTRKF
jgi:hypothetical protein